MNMKERSGWANARRFATVAGPRRQVGDLVMSEGELSAARRATLQRALEPGEELLWAAEAGAAPWAVWLPGCMAVPFLLIGLVMLPLGIGQAMGPPDKYTGYQAAYLFGGVGAVFALLGAFFIWLPFRLKRRYSDAIYGLTTMRMVQVLAASTGGSVQSTPLEGIISADGEAGSDGSGDLTVRVKRYRRHQGKMRLMPEAWKIDDVPNVAAARALIEQKAMEARTHGQV